MAVLPLYEWCLYPRREVACGDAAIREAIAQRSATVAFGAHLFAYRDEEVSQGRHVLTLTPLLREGEDNALEGYATEQRVPRDFRSGTRRAGGGSCWSWATCSSRTPLVS